MDFWRVLQIVVMTVLLIAVLFFVGVLAVDQIMTGIKDWNKEEPADEG